MNWKDELMEEMGYTICPICFPEYVHCNNDCEYCEEYIDFKQYYEGNKKVRKEAGRVNKEEVVQRLKFTSDEIDKDIKRFEETNNFEYIYDYNIYSTKEFIDELINAMENKQ